MMDLNSPDPTLEEIPLKSFNRTGFNPHGISIFLDPDTGGVRLFVVNHKTEVEAIEIFQFDQESKVLTHICSVVDDAIYSANSVIKPRVRKLHPLLCATVVMRVAAFC